MERITSILGSVTERIGEARDAASSAEQGVIRLNERLPAVEDNLKTELKHSVSVMENGMKRQLQGLGLAQVRELSMPAEKTQASCCWRGLPVAEFGAFSKPNSFSSHLDTM